MTTPSFTFSVLGTPRPKARPRFVNGRVVSAVSRTEKVWRAAVDRACREAVMNSQAGVPIFPAGVPVSVTMRFTFAPPASALDRCGQLHTQKPDRDNLEKLVLDAMTRAGVFADDGQVAMGPTLKVWGRMPGVVVLVERAAPAVEVEDPASPTLPDWLTGS